MISLIKKLSRRREKPKKRFTVTGPTPSIGKIEPTSATWVFVKTWASNEIETLRKKNDSLKVSEQQTTIYRSEIRLLKKILALSDTDKKKEGDSGLLNI